MWAQLEEVRDLNLREFPDLFGLQATAPKVFKPSENGNKLTKVKKAKILDPKRSQLVGILQKSLHVDISLVERALHEMDISLVNIDNLRNIYKVVSKLALKKRLRMYL